MAYEEYSADCDEDVTPRLCDNCDEQIELGGIRHAAFIRDDFAFTDPTDVAEWQQGITDGKIIMVTKIKGNCNGGEPKTIPGYGDQDELTLGYKYVLSIGDPAYTQNYNFWNTIRKSKRFKVAYFTDTRVHISDQVVSTKPKNPVDESKDTAVEWKADMSWFQKDLVIFHDASGLDDILTCSN